MRRTFLSAHLLRPALGSLLLAVTLGACGDDEEGVRSDPTPAPREHGLTSEQAEEVLAVVGEREITVGEFAEHLAAQNPYLRARYRSPERRRELLDSLIRFELLVIEAERRGYRDDAIVAEAERRALAEALLEETVDAELSPASVTEQEIRAYYESHSAEFDQPEQMRAAHILVATRAEARRLLRELAQNEDANLDTFRALAASRSLDEDTKARGGDLGFFSAPSEEPTEESQEESGAPSDRPPAPVARAAFELEENGEIADEIVQSDQGFHLVARVAHRPPLRRTLEEVERTIRQRLWREKREAAIEALVERLEREAEVEIDESALAAVRIEDESEGGPR